MAGNAAAVIKYDFYSQYSKYQQELMLFFLRKQLKTLTNCCYTRTETQWNMLLLENNSVW